MQNQHQNQHYSANINVMIKAIRKASEFLIRDFNELENLQAARKGASDFATKTIQKVKQILYNELGNSRPDYGLVIAGEYFEGRDPNYRFIINPLDGASNFFHALPLFCISIALEKTTSKDKTEIIAAVIESPVMRETFWAEKGSGAWNEKAHESALGKIRLRVSSRTKFSEILSYAQINQQHLDYYQRYLKQNMVIKDFGSVGLGLAFLAAGRVDSYFHLSDDYYNTAAGIMIVKESGGYVTNWAGEEDCNIANDIVISNNNFHKELIALLK